MRYAMRAKIRIEYMLPSLVGTCGKRSAENHMSRQCNSKRGLYGDRGEYTALLWQTNKSQELSL